MGGVRNGGLRNAQGYNAAMSAPDNIAALKVGAPRRNQG